jgi:hypothetical protein
MEPVGGFSSHHEMSVMDRIESAAEKGQSHDLVLPANPFPPGFV